VESSMDQYKKGSLCPSEHQLWYHLQDQRNCLERKGWCLSGVHLRQLWSAASASFHPGLPWATWTSSQHGGTKNSQKEGAGAACCDFATKVTYSLPRGKQTPACLGGGQGLAYHLLWLLEDPR
jgi:hypothetical protein